MRIGDKIKATAKGTTGSPFINGTITDICELGRETFITLRDGNNSVLIVNDWNIIEVEEKI
ncbi:MAG: hypothetical protein ACTTKJ_06510 [Prevotella koreensis]|uniref:hypothetical protein n=1 Tax=Prevotella koreensis TaxID=2490854 RepID=UPI003F9F8BBC